MKHINTKLIKSHIKNVDIRIANNIYYTRKNLNINRTELADAIGVSTQQLAKYEKAINRVAASRLALIAAKLQKKIEYFFS